MEIWKEIEATDGLYEVSSEGRLRRGTRVLKPRQHPKLGYVQGALHLPKGKRYPLMHRLVAAAFIGPIPEGHQVNHKNGVRWDNRVENLEIVTCSENNFHAYRVLNREKQLGEAHPNAKLTENDVLDIRWLFSLGVRQFILARKYALDKTVIRDIVHRYCWAHV
jgi:hypothetical protein